MEISLRQLSYFLRLVDKGSFTTAASALGITQPALSIAISQLEKALEVRLIERGLSPVTLTEFGRTFLRYALRVSRDLQEARHEIAALNSGALGRLDVAMGPSAAGPEAGSVLTSMIEDFPALEIHVQSAVLPAAAERLRNGEFSVYVGTVAEGFSDPTLEITPLTTLSLSVVAGATHPLARQGEVAPADLLGFPWIAIGNIDANLPNWQAAFRAAGLEPPRPAIDVRNITLVRSLLMEGLFVTILPRPMAQADIDAGLFAAVHPPSFDWSLRLDAVTRAGITLPAAARLFLDRLIKAFNADKGD
jgi:DNA-binding transcriptional LysR family regulator